MSASAEWLTENEIILAKLWGHLTYSEMNHINEELLEMISSANNKIHIIFDVHELNKFPTEIQMLRASGAYLQHDNLSSLVLVGIQNQIVRFLSSVVTQLTQTNMRQAKTVEDAIMLINQIDGISNATSE